MLRWAVLPGRPTGEYDRVQPEGGTVSVPLSRRLERVHCHISGYVCRLDLLPSHFLAFFSSLALLVAWLPFREPGKYGPIHCHVTGVYQQYLAT
jgi:hypothetical protein